MSDGEKILRLLKRGVSITQKQASNWFGCYRLGARIHELREAGYRIETTMIPNRKKRGKHAQYRMI